MTSQGTGWEGTVPKIEFGDGVDHCNMLHLDSVDVCFWELGKQHPTPILFKLLGNVDKISLNIFRLP